MKNKFWKAKSAESFNNNLPANEDPVTLIFKDAINELIKTKSKSSAVQIVELKEFLNFNDKQVKIIEKILHF